MLCPCTTPGKAMPSGERADIFPDQVHLICMWLSIVLQVCFGTASLRLHCELMTDTGKIKGIDAECFLCFIAWISAPFFHKLWVRFLVKIFYYFSKGEQKTEDWRAGKVTDVFAYMAELERNLRESKSRNVDDLSNAAASVEARSIKSKQFGFYFSDLITLSV